jgi:hypothetical protein
MDTSNQERVSAFLPADGDFDRIAGDPLGGNQGPILQSGGEGFGQCRVSEVEAGAAETLRETPL